MTVYVGQVLGSGSVDKDDGVVVTNQHVVGDARQVTVGFADGQRVAGTVVATDPVTDLGVVRVSRRRIAPGEMDGPACQAAIEGDQRCLGASTTPGRYCQCRHRAGELDGRWHALVANPSAAEWPPLPGRYRMFSSATLARVSR